MNLFYRIICMNLLLGIAFYSFDTKGMDFIPHGYQQEWKTHLNSYKERGRLFCAATLTFMGCGLLLRKDISYSNIRNALIATGSGFMLFKKRDFYFLWELYKEFKKDIKNPYFFKSESLWTCLAALDVLIALGGFALYNLICQTTDKDWLLLFGHSVRILLSSGVGLLTVAFNNESLEHGNLETKITFPFDFEYEKKYFLRMKHYMNFPFLIKKIVRNSEHFKNLPEEIVSTIIERADISNKIRKSINRLLSQYVLSEDSLKRFERTTYHQLYEKIWIKDFPLDEVENKKQRADACKNYYTSFGMRLVQFVGKKCLWGFMNPLEQRIYRARLKGKTEIAVTFDEEVRYFYPFFNDNDKYEYSKLELRLRALTTGQ